MYDSLLGLLGRAELHGHGTAHTAPDGPALLPELLLYHFQVGSLPLLRVEPDEHVHAAVQNVFEQRKKSAGNDVPVFSARLMHELALLSKRGCNDVTKGLRGPELGCLIPCPAYDEVRPCYIEVDLDLAHVPFVNDVHILPDDVRLGDGENHDVLISRKPRHSIASHDAGICIEPRPDGPFPATDLQESMSVCNTLHLPRLIPEHRNVLILERSEDIAEFFHVLLWFDQYLFGPGYDPVIKDPEIVFRRPALPLLHPCGERAGRGVKPPTEVCGALIILHPFTDPYIGMQGAILMHIMTETAHVHQGVHTKLQLLFHKLHLCLAPVVEVKEDHEGTGYIIHRFT